MAVNKRVTLFFQNNAGAGWSETYYVVAASVTSAMVKAANMKQRRELLLADDNFLTAARVSLDDPQRDSLLEAYATGPPVPGHTVASGDVAHTCLLCRVEATPLFKRQIYVRGIPDDVVTNNGRYFPGAAFLTAFNAWVFYLLGNDWGIRVLDRSLPKFAVASIIQDATTGWMSVLTTGAHGFATDDLVIIRGGAHGGKRARGRHRIVVTGGTAFMFPSCSLLDPYTGGLSVQKLEFLTVPMTAITALRIGHRITGRPFDAPRGRRRAHC